MNLKKLSLYALAILSITVMGDVRAQNNCEPPPVCSVGEILISDGAGLDGCLINPQCVPGEAEGGNNEHDAEPDDVFDGPVVIPIDPNVDEGPIKIRCPWICTNDERDDWRDTWDYSFDVCTTAFTDGPLGPLNQGDDRYNGGKQFNGLWLGVQFTGWWENMIDYCVERGIWTNVMKNNQSPGSFVYAANNFLSFEVLSIQEAEPPEIVLEELDIDGCNDGRICLRARPYGIITNIDNIDDGRPGGGGMGGGGSSPVNFEFNSPFLYFENLPDGEYSVRIKSGSASYKPNPQFNAKDGWEVSVHNNQLSVDNENVDHLFYELQVPGITLSRAGENFAGKDALFDYLENSDFFDRLGFKHDEKQNSLNYVRANLPQMPHYYLTILPSDEVEDISTLEVYTEAEKNVSILRTYFAIYPSRIEIFPQSGFDFPEISNSQAPLVKDYGEIIIKPDMQVYWR